MPFLRSLLALLTVVAAFAFQARMGGMVDIALPDSVLAMPMTGQQAVARHTSALVRPSPTTPDPISHQHQPTRNNSNKERHNHAAHCPFCVTGAFALEAGVLPLPTAPPRVAAHRQPLILADLPAAPRHADARAPPAFL